MRQASNLRGMVQQLEAAQSGLKNGGETTSEKQAEIARSLTSAEEELKGMLQRPGADSLEGLKEAVQKTGEASKSFSENKGSPESLASSKEAIAKAYEQSLARVVPVPPQQEQKQAQGGDAPADQKSSNPQDPQSPNLDQKSQAQSTHPPRPELPGEETDSNGTKLSLGGRRPRRPTP